MKKVTYFDVEWANGKNKSICQMGIMCEDYETEEPVFPESNLFIDPQDGFDDACVQIHGICAEKVAGSPTFPEVWKEVEKCFTNSIVIGHNVAGADLDALTKALQRYNIEIPEMYYVDTLKIARTYVPSFAVDGYSMSSLCKYFGVEIDVEHDAFDDACANKDLLTAMVQAYDFSIDDFVTKYEPKENSEFTQYIANPLLRKAVSDFYGVIQGINIDGKVSDAEFEYVKKWKNEYGKYSACSEVSEIISYIDEIASDGIITADELKNLHGMMTSYFETLSSSPVTIATQVLSGILKGVASDGEITLDECVELKRWLYENDYLKGHYPFDKITELLNEVLEDNVVTKEESESLLREIKAILDPVETLKAQVCDVKGRTVCLSGNFRYGQKSAVERFIESKGGIILNGVTKKLDILIVGALECEAYSNGTYGTKVKKALEYRRQGCNILIAKEDDLFDTSV